MILKIGEPQPKQKEFLSASTRFIGYGGGRGGGKSWSVRVKALLLAVNYPGIKILILRRTMPELRQNHIRPLSLMLYNCGSLTPDELAEGKAIWAKVPAYERGAEHKEILDIVNELEW